MGELLDQLLKLYSPKGGASLKSPSSGFSSKSVEALFAARGVNANPSNNPGTDSPSKGSQKKKTNAGAIAGAVFGVLLGLGLIAGIAFFFLRRRTQVVEMRCPSNSKPFVAARDMDKSELGGESPYTKSIAELSATDVVYYELPGSGKVELDGNSYIEAASRQGSSPGSANVSPTTLTVSPASG